MIRRLVICASLTIAPLLAAASELALPDGARLLIDRISAMDSYALPVGPYRDGGVPVRNMEGQVLRRTWRIDGSALSTLQILRPLRDQILSEGFDLVLDCKDRMCGGFDFRFQTEVAPAPSMYVDIRDYQFVSAVKNGGEAVGLLVSRSRTAAYIQIIRVTDPAEAGGDTDIPVQPAQPPARIDPEDAPPLISALVADGHAALGDLVFGSGSADLGPGPYASLRQLARFLEENPKTRIALVGHTDNAGSLENNIQLSKQRATAARERLVANYAIAPDRIAAEGMGYLAPIASNLTPEGRKENRRVEVILLSGH